MNSSTGSKHAAAFDDPLTVQELERAIAKLASKKAPGPDKISNEMIKHLGPKAKQVLLKFINKTWEEGQLPLLDWQEGRERGTHDDGQERQFCAMDWQERWRLGIRGRRSGICSLVAEVFHSWQFFTPILEYWANNKPKDFPNYPCGSWGPKSAEEMISKDGRKWRLI